MDPASLYRAHLQTLDAYLADALARAGRAGHSYDGVIFHAGRLATYHADDKEIPFEATPHFRRWVPLPGPEHCVVARPGRRPRVLRVEPRDYWYDTSLPPASYWEAAVEAETVESFSEAVGALGATARLAFVGGSREAAAELAIPPAAVEPAPLMAALDWHRAYKTDHEVRLLREACARAAAGHVAARQAFMDGGSEREIHWAYLRGAEALECELPFETIVATDEKGAILHYHRKRGTGAGPPRNLLLDAGAAFEGYAADLTRTWARDTADPLFVRLARGVDELQRDLVAMVTPGRPFPEIHLEAQRRVTLLLAETGVVRGSVEEAVERGLGRVFMPHGVGHHLGLQTHDVGGQLAGPGGETAPPPAEHPTLRTTRSLEPGHVVTIEPGLYFIGMLLDPLREGETGSLVDWKLVERLAPCGGIRIEDDVLCTAEGPRDLSRDLLSVP